jgi:hypothetical protein
VQGVTTVEPHVDIPEQILARQFDVAGNWGGLFEQLAHIPEVLTLPERIQAARVNAMVVPDNWGGLFEQPTHDLEERDFDLSTINILGST